MLGCTCQGGATGAAASYAKAQRLQVQQRGARDCALSSTGQPVQTAAFAASSCTTSSFTGRVPPLVHHKLACHRISAQRRHERTIVQCLQQQQREETATSNDVPVGRACKVLNGSNYALRSEGMHAADFGGHTLPISAVGHQG